MENARDRGIESNTLAILDATGFKDSKDDIDDRLTFLETVRATSIVPENGIPPTNKMYEALFQIFRGGKSLELVMSSYQLLIELNKRYPRVHLSNASVSSCSTPPEPELLVSKEAWSPFALGSDLIASERLSANKNLEASLDSADFVVLIEGLVEVVGIRDSKAVDMKTLGHMLLFQYLVEVLEGDFHPRHSLYMESNNWVHLRESLMNKLLGSRRVSYKGLVKGCKSIATMLCHPCAGDMLDMSDSRIPAEKPPEIPNSSLAFALVEAEKCIRVSLRRILVMMMELDESKKAAELGGQTTRADGVRTPALEIILDELTYDKDTVNPFFQVFDDPKWKLEMILKYFWKYAPKPSVRTRRSNVAAGDSTLAGLLNSFSNSTNAKPILKKIGGEVSQLLLAHAFEAYLSFSYKQKLENTDSLEILQKSSVVEICKSIICAFRSLKTADNHAVILPFGKEALFTAASILSTKS